MDLNICTARQLSRRTGITTDLCNAVIDYRRQVKEFKNLAQLKRIPGVTESVYDSLVKKGVYLTALRTPESTKTAKKHLCRSSNALPRRILPTVADKSNSPKPSSGKKKKTTLLPRRGTKDAQSNIQKKKNCSKTDKGNKTPEKETGASRDEGKSVVTNLILPPLVNNECFSFLKPIGVETSSSGNQIVVKYDTPRKSAPVSASNTMKQVVTLGPDSDSVKEISSVAPTSLKVHPPESPREGASPFRPVHRSIVADRASVDSEDKDKRRSIQNWLTKIPEEYRTKSSQNASLSENINLKPMPVPPYPRQQTSPIKSQVTYDKRNRLGSPFDRTNHNPKYGHLRSSRGKFADDIRERRSRSRHHSRGRMLRRGLTKEMSSSPERQHRHRTSWRRHRKELSRRDRDKLLARRRNDRSDTPDDHRTSCVIL